MIIELHLTRREDREIGDHLERCESAFCDHIAHLFAALVDDYAEVAAIRTLVDSSKWRHQRKRQVERDSDGAEFGDEIPASLAKIRQAWDRLEAAEREGRLKDLDDPPS